MSAARHLQRAIERNRPDQMCACDGPTWTLYASFEALAPDDDTLGADDIAPFLESYELDAGGLL